METSNAPKQKTNSAPPPPVANQGQLTKREAPELYKFESPGDCITGIILEMEKISIRGKAVMQYVIRDEKHRKTYQILGTYDINSKLSPSDRGRYVEIMFKERNESVQKNGNAMMVFDVFVEEKATVFSDGQRITDEDIPF